MAWECLQSFITPAKHNRVEMICMASCHRTAGNEFANLLAKSGLKNHTCMTQLACGISDGSGQEGIKEMKV
jgi:hypothetical protein